MVINKMVKNNYYEQDELLSMAKWYMTDEPAYLEQVKNVIFQKGYQKGFRFFASTCDNISYISNDTLAYVMGNSINLYGREIASYNIFKLLFKPAEIMTRQEPQIKKAYTKQEIINYFANNPNEKTYVVNDKIKAIKTTYFYKEKTVSRVNYYDTEKKRFTKNPNPN